MEGLAVDIFQAFWKLCSEPAQSEKCMCKKFANSGAVVCHLSPFGLGQPRRSDALLALVSRVLSGASFSICYLVGIS